MIRAACTECLLPFPRDLPAPACQTADRPQNEVARQAGEGVGRGEAL